MKKMILALFVSLSLLTATTGCSPVKEQVNATAVVDDLTKIVEPIIKNQKISRNAVDQPLDEFDKLVDKGNITPKIVKKAQPLLDNALKGAKAHNEAMKKIEGEVPKIKQLTAKFKDAKDTKLKGIADRLAIDFEETTKLDIEVAAVLEELIQADSKYLQSLGKDLSVNNVITKYNDLNKQLNISRDQFNKSWGALYTEVTGQKLKETTE